MGEFVLTERQILLGLAAVLAIALLATVLSIIGVRLAGARRRPKVNSMDAKAGMSDEPASEEMMQRQAQLEAESRERLKGNSEALAIYNELGKDLK